MLHMIQDNEHPYFISLIHISGAHLQSLATGIDDCDFAVNPESP